MSQKGFSGIIILIGILVLVGVAAGAYFFGKSQTINPQFQTTPAPSSILDASREPNGSAETANWKTYTYKNISFQYPNDWVVIFDSQVFGQPNGFSLHTENKNSSGYASDGLQISTSDMQNGYIMRQDRKFTQTSSGGSSIQFEVNGVNIYASCSFYSKDQTIIDICNQILSTFKFLP